MTRILLKSTLAAFLSAIACLFLVLVTVPQIGGIVDRWVLMVCIFCPLIAAWPASAYTFWQSDRLHKAHSALAAAHSELAEAHHTLKERARRDHMTGFLNRESFFAELDSHRRKSDGGALLIIDADHFKSINDRFGHLVGDEALLAMTGAIRRGLRANDIVGRIGGEEFGALLFGATGDDALEIAERVRGEVEAIAFRPDRKALYPLTVSIGGTDFMPGSSVSEQMRAADHKLYEAKQAGRNRTFLAFAVQQAA